jgi:hypothetical protein
MKRYLALLFSALVLSLGCVPAPPTALGLPEATDFPAAQPTQPQTPVPPLGPSVVDTPPLRFVAMGDMGSRLPGQTAMARQLYRAYQREPFAFVLMLGDNIYPNGDVAKWGKASFLDPYAPLLKCGVRFYAALGNHDVLDGHGPASMAFFGMPARYYTFEQGPVRFFALDTNQFDAVQQQWLKHGLGASSAPWNVVFGHHPVYSSGMHGNTRGLLERLRPILTAAATGRNVVYLAGHDHNYERFKPLDGGVHYIVSGGGGASLRPFSKKIRAGSVRRAVAYHAVWLEATAQRLGFTTRDAQGRVLDAGTLAPVRNAILQKPRLPLQTAS